jgi:hypothetical protein
MKNLTSEQIRKVKAAKSAEELLELAKANNIEMTEEAAKTYFEQLNANGAVSDEELDVMANGGCGDEEVTFEPGEVVELKTLCPDCECCLGIYQKADGIGGCIVQCMQCRRPIWFADTHSSIAKEYYKSSHAWL